MSLLLCNPLDAIPPAAEVRVRIDIEAEAQRKREVASDFGSLMALVLRHLTLARKDAFRVRFNHLCDKQSRTLVHAALVEKGYHVKSTPFKMEVHVPARLPAKAPLPANACFPLSTL